jgi:hypothetical protein
MGTQDTEQQQWAHKTQNDNNGHTRHRTTTMGTQDRERQQWAHRTTTMGTQDTERQQWAHKNEEKEHKKGNK